MEKKRGLRPDFVEGTILFVLGMFSFLTLIGIFQPLLTGVVDVADVFIESWTTAVIISIPSGGGYKAYMNRKSAREQTQSSNQDTGRPTPEDIKGGV